MKRSFLEFNNMSVQGVIEMKKPEDFRPFTKTCPTSHEGCSRPLRQLSNDVINLVSVLAE